LSKKDSVTNKYLRQSHIFADAFNYFIYGGRPIIDPASLEELDTRGIVLPHDSVNGSDEPLQRFRDSIKSVSAMYDDHGSYMILAVESQSYIDYTVIFARFSEHLIRSEKRSLLFTLCHAR
jgi:hypothetical protein